MIPNKKTNPGNSLQQSAKWMVLPGLMLILIAAGILYASCITGDFTNWDDDRHIINNPDIRSLSPENIKKIGTSYYLSLYQPLTTLVFALTYKFFALNPTAYHALNLVVHMINIGLVFWLFCLLTGRSMHALIVTAVFALHPLQVEAVAWISALSIVLNTTFYLGALIGYSYYLQSGCRYRYYFLTLVLFVLALLSKSTAISFPLMLMVFDLFFQRKINSRSIIEKIPFFLLSLLLGMIALQARHAVEHFIETTVVYTVIDRLCIISYELMHYAVKLILPFSLSAVYPFPQKTGQLLPLVFYSAPFGVAMLILLTFWFYKKNRVILFSPLFFLAAIVLMLQFMPFSMQMVSDRYTYLAVAGFFLLPATGIYVISQKYRILRVPLIVLMISYLTFLAITSYNRSQVWRDSLTLWNDVLLKYPDYPFALYHRGLAYYQQENYAAALSDYDQAIAYYPDYTDALNNRAVTHIQLNNNEQALKDINHLIDLNPNPEYFKNRALLKKRMGNLAGAVNDYNRALLADASDIEAYRQRGEIKARLKDFKGAIADYQEIIAQLPDDGYALYHLGILYYTTDQFTEAIAILRRSIGVKYILSPAAWYYIGSCYIALNQQSAACDAFTRSYDLGFNQAPEALNRYCPKK